jgi:hypothetical protein
MISVLLTIGALAMVGIIGPLVGLASKSQSTYGSDLEQYINSRNPQDTADVERMARDYHLSSSKRYL